MANISTVDVASWLPMLVVFEFGTAKLLCYWDERSKFWSDKIDAPWITWSDERIVATDACYLCLTCAKGCCSDEWWFEKETWRLDNRLELGYWIGLESLFGRDGPCLSISVLSISIYELLLWVNCERFTWLIGLALTTTVWLSLSISLTLRQFEELLLESRLGNDTLLPLSLRIFKEDFLDRFVPAEDYAILWCSFFWLSPIDECFWICSDSKP